MSNRTTCEQAVKQFFAYLDRAMAGEPLEALEQHLEECLDCCDRLQFSRQVDTFVRRRLGDDALPDGIEARIRQGIDRVRGGREGGN